MTTVQKSGFGARLRANFWVILADATGLVLLIAVLLAAGGSPALKGSLFVLLSGVPLAAVFMLLAQRPGKLNTAAVPARRSVRERRIVIAPRPIDQRACEAA